MLKIWAGNNQDIAMPCSIWSVVFDENEDIIVAGSDGHLRVFTTDSSRKAQQDVEEIFNKQVVEAASKKSGMSEQDIKKLLTTQQMSNIFDYLRSYKR